MTGSIGETAKMIFEYPSRGTVMNDTCGLSLVGGPAPLALPCVALRFAANVGEFSILLASDRTVHTPEWLDSSLSAAVVERARRFEKEHRIVIHELLKCARREISPNVSRRIKSSITEKPALDHAKELVFRMTLEDTELILHVSRQLVPCQIHLASGERCNSRLLFEAYDLALEYMQEHTEELDALGYDTSILRLSVQDWLGYRERFRVV